MLPKAHLTLHFYKRLTQTYPEWPGVSSGGMGRRWPDAGLGALSVAVHAWDLLRDVTIIFITSTIGIMLKKKKQKNTL